MGERAEGGERFAKWAFVVCFILALTLTYFGTVVGSPPHKDDSSLVSPSSIIELGGAMVVGALFVGAALVAYLLAFLALVCWLYIWRRRLKDGVAFAMLVAVASPVPIMALLYLALLVVAKIVNP
jgi:hypothetical protein